VIPGTVRALSAALLAAAVMLLVVGAAGALRHTPDDLRGGGVLSDSDRGELAAAPVLRGAEPAQPDPTVDLSDPEAVARAYLAAAHSVLPGDAGHTQLRAAVYAQPASPVASVGVFVLDPPPPGAYRSAEVTALQPVGADGNRRGYHAELATSTGPPGGPRTAALARALVVVAQQADGRWLVVAETTESPDHNADNPDLPAGEN
jgi:hypothetical protein